MSVLRAELQTLENRADGAKLRWAFEIEATSDTTCAVDILLKDRLMNPLIFSTTGTFSATASVPLTTGRNHLVYEQILPHLAMGYIHASIFVTRPFVKYYDKLDDVISFEIGQVDGGGHSHPLQQGQNFGAMGTALLPLLPAAVS